MAVKESELQRACLDWLKAHKITAWRMPIGPVKHSRGGRDVWSKSPLKGFPDIAGVLKVKTPGRFFVIELKSAKGTLRQEQKAWILKLQAAGAAVAVVRSIEELEEKMREWGEIKSRQ